MSHKSLLHSQSKALLEELNKTSAISISLNMLKNLDQQFYKEKLTAEERMFNSALIQHGTINSYIVPGLNSFESSIGVVSLNLTSIMFLALKATNKKFLSLYDYPFVLELQHIYSMQKSEVSSLIEVFKKVQKRVNVPGALSTESEQNVDFFKRFGFDNLGLLGDNGEFLLMLPRHKTTCPCCGYKTLTSEIHDICEICCWQDDPNQFLQPDSEVGANSGISLRQAQKNFIVYGACDECSIDDARKPNEKDVKDPNFKLLP